LIKRTTLFTSTAAFLGWFVFLVVGRWIIQLTVGPAFQDAYWVTVVYLLAMVVFLCSLSLGPSLLAMGLVRQSFFANVVATAVYFGLLFSLVRVIGIVGASFAYVGFSLVWSISMAIFLFSILGSWFKSGRDVVEAH
jgi:O-antigen/teichoic acid export membrane protein